jgi:hypothetical protein
MGVVFFVGFIVLSVAITALILYSSEKDNKRLISKNDLRVIIIAVLIYLVVFGLTVYI